MGLVYSPLTASNAFHACGTSLHQNGCSSTNTVGLRSSKNAMSSKINSSAPSTSILMKRGSGSSAHNLRSVVDFTQHLWSSLHAPIPPPALGLIRVVLAPNQPEPISIEPSSLVMAVDRMRGTFIFFQRFSTK